MKRAAAGLTLASGVTHCGDSKEGCPDTGTPAHPMLPMEPVELGFVSITMMHDSGFALPRLAFTAHGGVALDDEGVATGLGVIGTVLEHEKPFTILWDLRSCCLPSRAQLRYGFEWAAAHGPELDRYLAGIGILLTSRVVRVVADLVIRVTRPPQPVCFGREQERVDEFARPIKAPPRSNPKRQGAETGKGAA